MRRSGLSGRWLTVSELIDVTDAVKEMAGHDDPNQVARILDDILSQFDMRVVSGYNDNHRYKVVR